MEIKFTKNYEMFKLRKENREINYNKVMQLKSKLLEDGRQIVPVICNKDMEIIDGQHRFEALKDLNWNIMYYVDEGVTVKDLVSINNTQKNWGMMDYIHFYASLGNESYIKLEDICKEYSEIPLKAILQAISKKYIKNTMVKNGDLKITDEDIKDGIEALEFVRNIKNNIKVNITGQAIFFFLVIKAYYLQGINRNKLANSIISRYGTENYGDSLQCAAALEHWYNYKSKDYRYISNELLPRR